MNQKSFKNFEQCGICCRASPKEIVISNFLKMSRNRANFHSLYFFDGTKGYDTSFPIHGIAFFFFSRASSLLVFFSPSLSFSFSFFSFSSFPFSFYFCFPSPFISFSFSFIDFSFNWSSSSFSPSSITSSCHQLFFPHP